MALAQALKNAPLEILLIDKNNYHTFQPLLYQVATSALEPDSIAAPFRDIFKRQKNFFFRMAEVQAVNPEQKTVTTSLGDFSYDYLAIATGSATNYYGMKDIEEHALPMKSIHEALALRSLILKRLELALSEKDEKRKRSLMTVVIIGGGPTGVELAGALGELKKILPHDYPELDISQWEIYLVDLGPKLLGSMSDKSSREAEKTLRKYGVRLLLNTQVKSFDGMEMIFSDGKKIPSETLIWTAGVKGTVLPGLERWAVKGRIEVNAYNQIEGVHDIFVIGDTAHQTHENPAGYPMLAPVAIQQAENLAENILRTEQNKPLRPFHYKNKGVMATIGRNHGVVDLKKAHLDGALAWFIWLFIHLFALVGFRNRLVALINWTWNYFTFNRGLRLIIPLPEKKNEFADAKKF